MHTNPLYIWVDKIQDQHQGTKTPRHHSMLGELEVSTSIHAPYPNDPHILATTLRLKQQVDKQPPPITDDERRDGRVTALHALMVPAKTCTCPLIITPPSGLDVSR